MLVISAQNRIILPNNTCNINKNRTFSEKMMKLELENNFNKVKKIFG